MPLLTAKAFDDPFTQDDLESAPGAASGAAFDQALSDLPLLSLGRSQELAQARSGVAFYGPFQQSKRYSPTDASAYMAERGLDQHFTFDRQHNEDELRILARRKTEELKRQNILSRADSGFAAGAGRFGITLATQLLDPLAVGSALVPIIGEARYGAMLAKAGGAFGRAGVRAGVGAAEGMAGAAVLEPLIYAAKAQEQADYTMADSLLNIGIGGAFGGGLHVAGGAISDIGRASREARVNARAAAIQKILDDQEALNAPAPYTPIETTERRLKVADVETSVEGLYARRKAELESATTGKLSVADETALREQYTQLRKDAAAIDDSVDPEGAAALDQRVAEAAATLNRHEFADLADGELRRLESAWTRAKSAKDKASVIHGDDAPVWQQLDYAERGDTLEALETRIADLEERRPLVANQMAEVEAAGKSAAASPLAAERMPEIEARRQDLHRQLRKIDGDLFQLKPVRDELSKQLINAPRVIVMKAAPATREAALRTAVGQAVSGSPIELRPIFDRSPAMAREAAQRLSDADVKELADANAVQLADSRIAEGETADLASLEAQSAELDSQIKALTDDAATIADDAGEALMTLMEEVNAEVAQAEALARESTRHANLLVTCAMKAA